MKAVFTAVALSATSMISISAASAQDVPDTAAAPSTSGDIVVTAQRRDQRLQDVAIAVSAFNGDDLRTRQVLSSSDIARSTPGVTAASAFAGQASTFSIRGVVQNVFNDMAEGPVAVYVDDAYLPNVQAQNFGLFDLERVEVLKGPQGTLFGRNSTGGLANFVIAKPTDTFTGFLNTSFGSYNNVRSEGAISGPLSDTITARASVMYNSRDGWLNNLYPGGSDFGGIREIAGRLQLQAKPTDRLTMRLAGSLYKSRLSVGPYNSVASKPIYDSQGRWVDGYISGGATTQGYTPPSAESLDVNINYSCDSCAFVNVYNGTLHADYELDTFTISSITAFTQVEKSLLNDVEEGPSNLFTTAQAGTTRGFTQELRATGSTDHLVWNTGVYYLNSRIRDKVGNLYFPGSATANLYAPDQGVDLLSRDYMTKQSASAFGQLEYKVSPTLTAVLGGRFIHEWLDYRVTGSAYLNENDYKTDTDTVLVANLNAPFSTTRSYNMWAGKVGLEYRPARDTLLYATVSRGVKGAGYNIRTPGSAAFQPGERAFDPETLLSYEVGSKMTLLGGALTLDGSIYYYDYSNYQGFLFLLQGGVIANNDAEIYGGELQGTLRPVEGLALTLGGSYNHATVKDVTIASGVTKDVRPTFAPRMQLTGRVEYTVPADIFGGTVRGSVDGFYQSMSYSNIRNFGSQELPSYALFNGMLRWEGSQGISISGNVSNIFDKRYLTTSFDLSTFCGCSEVAYGMPRTWSVTLGYKF